MTMFTLAQQAFQPGDLTLTLAQSINHFFVAVKLIVAIFGTITILIGGVLAIYRYFLYRFGSQLVKMVVIRLDLAKSIILGLEFFVAADVIETTIAPDFSSLGVLAVLVIIRSILNYSMEREIKNLSIHKD